MISYTIWVGETPTPSHVQIIEGIIRRTQDKLGETHFNHMLHLVGPKRKQMMRRLCGSPLNTSIEKHKLGGRFCIVVGSSERSLSGYEQILVI